MTSAKMREKESRHSLEGTGGWEAWLRNRGLSQLAARTVAGVFTASLR
jgi:hypothetical protein